MPHLPPPEPGVGVTRLIDGTVKLETDAGNVSISRAQARELADLLDKAGEEPLTTKDVVVATLMVAGVVAFAIGVAFIAAS